MKKEEAGGVLFKPQIHKPNQLYMLQLKYILQMKNKRRQEECSLNLRSTNQTAVYSPTQVYSPNEKRGGRKSAL
jgi:hypothetical protein